MNKLTKTKLGRFTKLFKERRAEILKRVMNNDIELDAEGDDVDVIQATQLLDLASRLSSRDMQNLTQINIALERIEAGTFGLCEACDNPIGEKRLIAIPQCTLCIECQEESEQNDKQFIQ